MQIASPATLVGDGASHALSATRATARWVQVRAGLQNSGVAKIGDSTVGAGAGLSLNPGEAFFFPPYTGDPTEVYQLNQMFYQLQASDTLQVLFA